MFEFHGWATIRVPDPVREGDGRHELEKIAIERLREAIREVDDQFSLFDLRVTSNELIVLYVHGLRNHRYGNVVTLFQWVATELPESYGLLYIHDDEADGQENEFRAWRLARGELRDMSDPFLSPCIPTLEDPWAGEPDGPLVA